MTRLRLALALFWWATLVSRWLQKSRGWPPWVCFRLGLPLVKGLCRLACWVGPKGEG